MSKEKSKEHKPISPKKELRIQISNQLTTALVELNQQLGRKEFESRLKKAVRLLTAGLKKKPVKIAKAKPVKKEIVVAEEKTA